MARIYADPLVMEYWEVRTCEQSLQEYHHFVSSMKEHGWGFWAVELKESHKFIGLIGLENIAFQAHFTPAVEIGWRLASNYWGQGYATEGAEAALRFGFEALDLSEIVSFTAVANKRSRRIMEKPNKRPNVPEEVDRLPGSFFQHHLKNSTRMFSFFNHLIIGLIRL